MCHVEVLEEQRREEAKDQAQEQAGCKEVQELAKDDAHGGCIHLWRLTQALHGSKNACFRRALQTVSL